MYLLVNPPMYRHVFLYINLSDARGPTSDGLLVVLDGAPPLHLHHAPLDAAVADVAEVLGVPLDTVGHRVAGGGREAALALLKVLVVSDL